MHGSFNAAKAVMAGTWKPQSTWLGVGQGGCVKMTTSNSELPESVAKEMKAAEEAIVGGKLKFAGEIKGQNGNVKVAAGQELSEKRHQGHGMADRRLAGYSATKLIARDH